MVLGTIPLFIVAGFTEGTISQIHEPHIPSAIKLAYAAMMALLLAGVPRCRRTRGPSSASPR